MADAATLRQVAARSLPLVDDFPRRVDSGNPTKRAAPLFARLMDGDGSRERLNGSSWIAGILPRSLLAGSGERFRQRAMLDAASYPEIRRPGESLWSDLAALIQHSELVNAPRWMLDSEERKVEIAASRGTNDPQAIEHLAIDALANRRLPGPALPQEQFQAMTPKAQLVTIFRHCLSGQRAAATSLMNAIPAERRAMGPYPSFLAWAADNCR